MNNSQPLLYIAFPSILILAGMFFNWSAANGIRSEINGLRSELKGDINSLRNELKVDIHGLRSEVYGKFDKFDAKLDDIENANHKDALEIVRQTTAPHERVAIVESRQK